VSKDLEHGDLIGVLPFYLEQWRGLRCARYPPEYIRMEGTPVSLVGYKVKKR
jgi:hypothetical protein